MKKILCLLHLPPPTYGVTILNKNIVEGQLNKHFTLDIISINTARKLSEVEKLSLAKIFAFFCILSKLIKKIVFNRYCLCYFSLTPTGKAFYKDLIFVLLLKIFHLNRLYHLHGKGVSLKKRLINKLLFKFCFHNSKVIIISKSLFYDIKDYVCGDNIFILPNAIKPGIGDQEFEEIVKKRKERKTVTLLFLSNITKSKGVFDALEAARILKSKGLDFKFYFAGDWKDISEKYFFNRVAQYNLNKEVKYLGFKKGEEKSETLRKSDIFVFPTYNDIFGIVNLEAMEYGLPIVSTNEGSIPEIIDEGITGFIVPKQNYFVLADRIETLIIDKEKRIAMGLEGRKKFLRMYTLKNFEKKLLNIFNETIAKYNETSYPKLQNR